jgi:hypothetical protein
MLARLITSPKINSELLTTQKRHTTDVSNFSWRKYDVMSWRIEHNMYHVTHRIADNKYLVRIFGSVECERIKDTQHSFGMLTTLLLESRGNQIFIP